MSHIRNKVGSGWAKDRWSDWFKGPYPGCENTCYGRAEPGGEAGDPEQGDGGAPVSDLRLHQVITSLNKIFIPTDRKSFVLCVFVCTVRTYPTAQSWGFSEWTAISLNLELLLIGIYIYT
jgi:hypothetical protein